jgi:hypothetical protein
MPNWELLLLTAPVDGVVQQLALLGIEPLPCHIEIGPTM